MAPPSALGPYSTELKPFDTRSSAMSKVVNRLQVGIAVVRRVDGDAVDEDRHLADVEAADVDGRLVALADPREADARRQRQCTRQRDAVVGRDRLSSPAYRRPGWSHHRPSRSPSDSAVTDTSTRPRRTCRRRRPSDLTAQPRDGGTQARRSRRRASAGRVRGAARARSDDRPSAAPADTPGEPALTTSCPSDVRPAPPAPRAPPRRPPSRAWRPELDLRELLLPRGHSVIPRRPIPAPGATDRRQISIPARQPTPRTPERGEPHYDAHGRPVLPPRTPPSVTLRAAVRRAPHITDGPYMTHSDSFYGIR